MSDREMDLNSIVLREPQRPAVPGRNIYANETPITDPKEALRLLAPQEGRWISARLYDGAYHHDVPSIEIWWSGPGQSDPPPVLYRVDQACVEELRSHDWVESVPRSMSRADPHIMKITMSGRVQLGVWRDEEKAEACAFLDSHGYAPAFAFEYQGKRSLLDSVPGGRRIGHLFSGPGDELVMVFLDTKTVEKVHEDHIR